MTNDYKTELNFQEAVSRKLCCACININKYLDVFTCIKQSECVSLCGSCDVFKECIHSFSEIMKLDIAECDNA